MVAKAEAANFPPESVMKLSLKVVPGASRNEITGWSGESLKVRVTAPAERGKANAAVKKILADALHVPKAAIEIVSGITTPRKVVEIRGLTADELYERLDSKDT